MPKTTLQLINSTLALIGEQALLSSTGTLGDLVRDAVNTALVNVAQETRANTFETTIQGTASNNDYLVPVLTLPANVLQVFTVSLRVSTGTSFGDNLIQLDYLPLESLTVEPAYSISGANLYLSPTIARPASLFIRALQAFTLPTNDNTDSGLPDVVIPSVQHIAASILALSYLDDSNQAAVQQKIATSLLDKLKAQYGNFRAKSFNVSGQRKNSGFNSGGLSGISGAVAYAPLDSPALIGTPTAPTPATANNSTQLATTAYVQHNLASYVPTSSLSSYLTIASAASTYAPLVSPALTGTPTAPTAATADNTTAIATTAHVKANLASYLTIASASSTYAPLSSPALTGTPTAPTPATADNSTRLATTAYVKAQLVNNPLVVVKQTSGQTIPHNISTTVIFNQVITDSFSAYNNSTGEFTAPVSGWYSVFTNLGVTTPAQILLAAVKVDGGDVRWLPRQDASGDILYGVGGSAVVQLTAGQKLTIALVQINSTSSSRTIIGALQNSLEIFLVSAS